MRFRDQLEFQTRNDVSIAQTGFWKLSILGTAG